MNVQPVVNPKRQIAKPRAELSLSEIWNIARIRAALIFGSAAILFVLVAMIDLGETPLYKGTSVLMIDKRQNKLINIEDVLSGLPTDQASMLNQIQILQSHQLAWRVIRQLKLDGDPEFNPTLRKSLLSYIGWLNPLTWFPDRDMSPQLQAERLKDDIIEKFEKRLSVSQLQLSTTLQIDFESEKPTDAANIANAIADAYVVDQMNAKFDATVQASHWLASRLGALARQARSAQDAVEQFKAEHHITEVVGSTGSGVVSVLDQQIGALNAQLVQAHTDVAQAEASLARVRMLVSSGRAADVTQVVGSALIGQLVQQQATLIQQQAQLSSRYGPDHPKMLDMAAEKRDLDAKIRQEIALVVGTAENDVAVARARESSLQQSLDRLESQSTVQGEARVKLRQLESNASSSRALYESFVARSKETQQQEELQLPDARVISRSPIPLRASFPNDELVLGFGATGAVFFGFVLALILERLDHGFRTTARTEAILNLPVLATFPDITPSDFLHLSRIAPSTDKRPGELVSVADLVVDRPLSSYSEAVRGLQLGIALSNVDEAPRVVLVTSALPSEGKTTTALSFSRHLAQIGQNVVLVDADLRRPNVQAAARLKSHGKDLIDLLTGSATLDEVLVKDPKSAAMILYSSRHMKNAPGLIESQAMVNVILDLRKRFDTVVVDSAPILPVTDTRILVRLVDAVLFVVRWERTPREAAADAVKSLREARAPIAGVALSRADTKRFHYYSFGYGGYYYAYSRYYESHGA